MLFDNFYKFCHCVFHNVVYNHIIIFFGVQELLFRVLDAQLLFLAALAAAFFKTADKLVERGRLHEDRHRLRYFFFHDKGSLDVYLKNYVRS